MKQYIKKLSMVLVLMAFAVIVALATPGETKAATAFKGNAAGKVTKCGSYYIKRNKTGIYKSKKKNSGFKLVVKAATSTAKDLGKTAYGFTSDGTTIYYAVNDNKTNKGVIYSIKATGKSKKTIYKAKHQVNVYYAYGGNIIYKSDVHGKKNFVEDYYYQYNPKSTAKTKYTKVINGIDWISGSDFTGGELEFVHYKETNGKYVIFIKEEDGSRVLCVWDMKKQKLYCAPLGDNINYKSGVKSYILKDSTIYYLNAWEGDDYPCTVYKTKLFSNKYTGLTKTFSAYKINSFSLNKVVYIDLDGKSQTLTY